jgi:hypothetical protein
MECLQEYHDDYRQLTRGLNSKTLASLRPKPPDDGPPLRSSTLPPSKNLDHNSTHFARAHSYTHVKDLTLAYVKSHLQVREINQIIALVHMFVIQIEACACRTHYFLEKSCDFRSGCWYGF